MQCNNPAGLRYTWAGKDEARCCVEHAAQIGAVANAIGYYVQMIPLTVEEILADDQCTNEVREDDIG